MIKTVFTRRILPSAFIAALALTAAHAAEPVHLITSEEAGLPALDVIGGQVRNLTRGPGINTLATPIAVSGRPFRFAVRFMPRNGVPLDPASVRLIYRRQPTLDITARVKPFITAHGIEAPAVVVPPGRHVIEIEAADKEGRVGRSQVMLTVDPPNEPLTASGSSATAAPARTICRKVCRAGEQPSPTQAAGGGAILAAVLLVRRG